MKFVKSCMFIAVVWAAMLMSAGRASAQIFAFDYAAPYTRATWATNRANLGFGFTQWALMATSTNVPQNKAGFTITAGGAIASDTNANSWGIFANQNFQASATAYRGFSNSLPVGDVFKIQFLTAGPGVNAGQSGGYSLRNGNTTNNTADWQTSLRFAFYYTGNSGSNSYIVWDGNGPNWIGVPFDSGGPNGMQCDLILLTADTYRFVLRTVNTGTILAILDNQPLANSGTIDSVAMFSVNAANNMLYNRMQIVSASLVPPTIVNVQPANSSIYVDPTSTNISFEVDSAGSLLNTNGITLLLNGVAQTNLGFNSLTPTNQLLVTNKTPLVGNTIYKVAVFATDSNGNVSSNNFSFNTFLQTDPFIEGEDYNFASGQFLSIFPDPLGAYAGLLGSNTIDYLELDLSGTNLAGVYRNGDMPQVLAVTGDPVDHAGYAAGPYSDYEIGYTQTGEWLNYTRKLDNTNYTMYVRAASGGGGTILMERLADPTATTPTQPRAALGTFIVPPTGGSKIYSGALVPLTDFFSKTVEFRFAGTNTFRETALNNQAFNLNYWILVPNSNTNTLRPYLASGFPYPGATSVGLDTSITFTIANRQTAVNPATVQLFLNSNALTGLTFSNNAAGTVVTHLSTSFLPPNATNTLKAIFSDNAVSPVSQTNTWTFTSANAPVITLPGADAQPTGSGATLGFAGRIYKIDDNATTTASIVHAEAELAGQITNVNTSQPYPNLVNGGPNADGAFTETNTINYDIQGIPTGTATFPFKSPFPYLAPTNVDNNIAIEALMYLQLSAGNYVFAVRSDDGFRLTVGPTPGDTNFVIGQFDGGRGNGTPSLMYVTVTNTGLYPMRLLYFQAGSGGSVEFYSISNADAVLINDPTNATSLKVFASLSSAANPVTILGTAHSGNTTTFHFLTQSGHTHYVEFKDHLTDATWSPLQTVNGDGTTANISDPAASGTTRFYRVRSL